MEIIYKIENLIADIYVSTDGRDYNVEYRWELTDTNEYWGAIEGIYCYTTDSNVDENTDEYKQLEEVVYDLDLEKLLCNA